MTSDMVTSETTTDADIRRILTDHRHIAVVGMSASPGKPSRSVPAGLKARGYTIIPINPKADRIIGLKCYPTLDDVPPDVRVDMVDVFRPPAEVPAVMEAVLRRLHAVGDVKAVWVQEGIASARARAMAAEAGLEYVEDRCIWKEYARVMGGG